MHLNLLGEEKSVSAGSLFHILITCSQKKVVRIFRLFDFLNNLYLVNSLPGMSVARSCFDVPLRFLPSYAHYVVYKHFR